MKERLLQPYLDFVAERVESNCQTCYDHVSTEITALMRGEIRNYLTQLGKDWDEEGFAGTTFTEVLMKKCDDCCERGQAERAIIRFSCGIRVRLPEPLTVVR